MPKAPDPRSADELPLWELVCEDFVTYDQRLTEPGFWAVAAHRLGRRCGRIRRKPVRAALHTCHRVLAKGVDLLWGIQISHGTMLGRRVRLWHSGCMQLEARSIGNDVHIRHDTTLGALRVRDTGPLHWPVIEDGVELGAGVSVLGAVRVGHHSFVGANSLVVKHVPPNSMVLGVPARMVPA